MIKLAREHERGSENQQKQPDADERAVGNYVYFSFFHRYSA
jgi:hypothetical protein